MAVDLTQGQLDDLTHMAVNEMTWHNHNRDSWDSYREGISDALFICGYKMSKADNMLMEVYNKETDKDDKYFH